MGILKGKIETSTNKHITIDVDNHIKLEALALPTADETCSLGNIEIHAFEINTGIVYQIILDKKVIKKIEWIRQEKVYKDIICAPTFITKDGDLIP